VKYPENCIKTPNCHLSSTKNYNRFNNRTLNSNQNLHSTAIDATAIKTSTSSTFINQNQTTTTATTTMVDSFKSIVKQARDNINDIKKFNADNLNLNNSIYKQNQNQNNDSPQLLNNTNDFQSTILFDDKNSENVGDLINSQSKFYLFFATYDCIMIGI
jgi:hypothetical protein